MDHSHRRSVRPHAHRYASDGEPSNGQRKLRGRVAAALAIQWLCVVCVACQSETSQALPSQIASRSTPATAITARNDCDWDSSTICDGPATAPGPPLAGASFVASVHVDTIDATVFNTASGHPPDEPYDDERFPEALRDATVEAVFQEHGGPDWMDREWDETMEQAEATAAAIEADFDARWREMHGFELGHLVVMRVESDPGVLRGDPELGWVVSVMRGGRAEVQEGRHAGCVFESHFLGCQEYVELDQTGLALLGPVSDGRADDFHFFAMCKARAAALERDTGTVARCMELNWFLRETDGGWAWAGGEGDGVLDLGRVTALMDGQ